MQSRLVRYKSVEEITESRTKVCAQCATEHIHNNCYCNHSKLAVKDVVGEHAYLSCPILGVFISPNAFLFPSFFPNSRIFQSFLGSSVFSSHVREMFSVFILNWNVSEDLFFVVLISVQGICYVFLRNHIPLNSSFFLVFCVNSAIFTKIQQYRAFKTFLALRGGPFENNIISRYWSRHGVNRQLLENYW